MTTDPSLNKEVRTMPHPYVGLWMTADGLI